eukprot:8772642-Heterocapsa_arctica.AAC.1
MVMNVKFCAQLAPAVIVELTPAALRYVKYAMLSSEQDIAPRAWKDVVHWREDRGRFIAMRSDETSGANVQKSFKPTDDGAAAMAACKEAAKNWVQVGGRGRLRAVRGWHRQMNWVASMARLRL